MTSRGNQDRHHFVFVESCGCPFGLVEQGSWCRDIDQAWSRMYETRAKEREAHRRGVQAVLVDHATYVAEFYPRMLARCPHREASTGPEQPALFGEAS
jgi:hypothetical protein